MSSATQPLPRDAEPGVPEVPGAPIPRGRWADYAQLTKPRITLLVTLTTMVGFIEATRAPRSCSVDRRGDGCRGTE